MSGKRILVAEDDPMMNLMYRTAFAKFFPEYTIHVTRDGAEATEQLEQTQYGLIITDLNMPRVDGCELYQAALKISETSGRYMPPFIFCSGVELSLDTARETCAGELNRFILKPFSLTQIQAAIHDIIDSTPRSA